MNRLRLLTSSLLLVVLASACAPPEEKLPDSLQIGRSPDTAFIPLSARLNHEGGREGGDSTVVTCSEAEYSHAAQEFVEDAWREGLDPVEGECALWIAFATHPSLPVQVTMDSVRYAADTAITYITYDARFARQDRSMRPVLVVGIHRRVRSIRRVVTRLQT